MKIYETHVVHELLDHAVPLARVLVLGAVPPVLHQADLVREAQDAGQLSQQVYAESLEAVVPVQRLVRLLEHHIWLFLSSEKEEGVSLHVSTALGIFLPSDKAYLKGV